MGILDLAYDPSQEFVSMPSCNSNHVFHPLGLTSLMVRIQKGEKGIFFKWFCFSINIGALISSSLLVCIQDNAEWGLGFGNLALFMAIVIGSFF